MLVGNMIALVILGVSATGLITYTSTVQRVVKSNIESVEYKPVLKTAMLNSLKSLLIEKNRKEDGERSDKNTYGVCSLIQIPSKVEPGVSKIKLDLHNIDTKDNKSWSLSRWEYFFSRTEYQFVSGTECQKRFRNFKSINNTSKCLKYIGSDLSEIYAFVSWTPKTFPNLSNIDTNNPETAILDPKKVIFYLKVELAGAGGDENKHSALTVSSQTDMIWANDVGECQITKGKDNFLVTFSGTGLGSSLQIRLINSPYAVLPSVDSSGGENCQKNLKIGDLYSSNIQVGDVSGSNVSSLSSLNVRASCTRNTFKCRETIENSPKLDGYDDFQIHFSVTNESNAEISVDKMELTFKKDKGPPLYHGPLKSYRYRSSKPLTPNAISSSQALANIPVGKSAILGKLEEGQTATACHDICHQYEPEKTNTYFYPSTIKIQGENNTCSWKRDNYWADDNNRVRCTVCYMKACHRFGLGTFGPFRSEATVFNRIIKDLALSEEQKSDLTEDLLDQGLPGEALDNPLPECATKREADKLKTTFSLPEDKDEDALETKKCIALNIRETEGLMFNNSDNSKLYSAENCADKLPVLCFAGGQYRPAMQVKDSNNLSSPLEVVTSDFKGAQKACMEMGREIGRSWDLGMLFWKMWTSLDNSNPSTVFTKVNRTINSLGPGAVNFPNSLNWENNQKESSKYDFINNATRGMFLTPPDQPDIPYVTKKIKRQITDAQKQNTKMWVAMETDAGGFVMASPPYAELTKQHPFALYFGKAPGNPITLLKDTAKSPRAGKSVSSTSPYLALAHSLRWKGLYQEEKSTELPFLCKSLDTGKFFVTTAKGAIVTKSGENKDTTGENTKAGHTACNTQGGQFVPPISSMEWAQALLALNPHDPHLPFPDPLSDLPSCSLNEGACEPPCALNAKGQCKQWLPTNNFLYEKAVEPKRAWVALKAQGKTKKKLVKDDGSTTLTVKSMRYLNDFPANSIFNTPDKDLPADENKGVIDGEGVLYKKPLAKTKKVGGKEKAVKTIERQKHVKKLCLNKSSVTLKSIGYDELCASPAESVTEGDLKGKYRKSIRFMVAWKQAKIPKTAKFIIDTDLLDQFEKKALNGLCKQIAEKVYGECVKPCEPNYRICIRSCPADDVDTTDVNENQDCQIACKNNYNQCIASCNSQQQSAKSTCNDAHPIVDN